MRSSSALCANGRRRSSPPSVIGSREARAANGRPCRRLGRKSASPRSPRRYAAMTATPSMSTSPSVGLPNSFARWASPSSARSSSVKSILTSRRQAAARSVSPASRPSCKGRQAVPSDGNSPRPKLQSERVPGMVGGSMMAASGTRMAVTQFEPKAARPENPDETAAFLSYYRDMLLIRRFEEKAGQMYGMGLIGGFCHLYIGQEAVVVGVGAAIEAGDTVITAYRDHGHMLAAGMDPKGVMAELTGRRGGYSRGKGGSMHMFSREKNFFGGHGIVGAQVPIGTGLALAHRNRQNGRVSLTFMGDGAMNQGQVYESFNMAALWKLPVVYIIENNRYGMGTAITRSSASPDLFSRGAPFGIPGHQVDGMNVVAVIAAVQEAVEYARGGKGPFILEMLTYRYRGHSMSDPAKYRTRDEVSRMREEHDPIDQARKRLMDGGHADEARLKELDKEVKDL